MNRLVLIALTSAAAVFAQEKIEATLLFTVSQPAAHNLSKKFAFSTQAKAGPGQDLKLWLTANRDCKAVAVAFTRDGKLAYAGPPERVSVASHKTTEIPAQRKWPWEGKENLAEIDIVIAGDSSKDYQDLSKLVDAMNDSSLPDATRRRQVAALRRWVDEHSQNASTLADYKAKPLPEEVGAMLRGGSLDGQKVAIPANGYTVIRLKLE